MKLFRKVLALLALVGILAMPGMAYYYHDAIPLGSVVVNGRPMERQLGLSGILQMQEQQRQQVCGCEKCDCTAATIIAPIKPETKEDGVFCILSASDTDSVSMTVINGHGRLINREWDVLYTHTKMKEAFAKTEAALQGMSPDLETFETTLKQFWKGSMWEVMKDGKTYLVTVAGFHNDAGQPSIGICSINWDSQTSKIKVFQHGWVRLWKGPVQGTLTLPENKIRADSWLQIQ